TLSGAVTGSAACTGVTLGGSGGTVTMSGGMTLNGAADTFSSTTAGLTIDVTGPHPIGATTAPPGPPPHNPGPPTGASGATLQKVSATGGANGIVVNGTGAVGGFTVTGTIGSTTRDGSGGTIQGSTGADGSSAGHGIFLNATTNTSLAHMNVQDAQGDAIH